MWINKTDPSELLQLRHHLENRMRDADAVVYDLTEPAWRGAFVDFPIIDDEKSYTATGYWPTEQPRPNTDASLTIATAPIGGEETLRWRYRADLRYREAAEMHDSSPGEPDVPSSKSVSLLRNGVSVAQTIFSRTHSERVVAEMYDGTSFLLLFAVSEDSLPAHTTIEMTDQYEHLIAHWREL